MHQYFTYNKFIISNFAGQRDAKVDEDSVETYRISFERFPT